MVQKWFQDFLIILGPKVRRLLVLSVLIGIIWFFVELSFIYVIQAFFFTLGLVSSESLNLPQMLLTSPYIGLGLLIAFGIIRGLLMGVRFYLVGVIGQEFLGYHRSLMIGHSFYGDHNKSSGDVISRFSDRLAYASTVVQSVGALVSLAVSITLITVAGFYIAPLEFFSGILILGFLAWPLILLNKNIDMAGETLAKHWKDLLNAMIYGIRNQFLLKLYRKTNGEVNHCRELVFESLVAWRSYYGAAAIKNSYPLMIGTIVICLIVIVSMNFGEGDGVRLITIFYLFLRLAQMASDASSCINDIRLRSSALDEARENYELASRMNAPSLKKRLSQDIHSIEAQGVAFSYGAKKVLQDINFRVETGRALLLKGPSGAGKSTLVSLIGGLLVPESGKILINGNELAHEVDMGHQIAYVGPEPFLLAGTVRGNLSYCADIKYSDRELIDALRKAQALELVEALPNGLDTELSEHAELSTGQKQRISLARALLRKPKLLFLDEATSNLDLETESKILKALEVLKPEFATVVISHKTTFDNFADQVIELEK